MSMFKKILVPYDGSKPSENALNTAVDFAESIGSNLEIILLTVIPEIPVPPMILEGRFRSTKTGQEASLYEIIKELHQDFKSTELQKLNEIKGKMRSSNFEIRTRAVVGYPQDVIVETAKDENVDLIIIGNIGLSGIKKIKTLGSVSRSVSERAHCPVMIVR